MSADFFYIDTLVYHKFNLMLKQICPKFVISLTLVICLPKVQVDKLL